MARAYRRAYAYRPTRTRISPDAINPESLCRVLEEPELALAAAIVLQALDELRTSFEARALFHSAWFGLFCDAIETEPQRLRARLGVPATSPDISAEMSARRLHPADCAMVLSAFHLANASTNSCSSAPS